MRIKCASPPGSTRGWGIKFCTAVLGEKGGAMITFGGIDGSGLKFQKEFQKVD